MGGSLPPWAPAFAGALMPSGAPTYGALTYIANGVAHAQPRHAELVCAPHAFGSSVFEA